MNDLHFMAKTKRLEILITFAESVYHQTAGKYTLTSDDIQPRGLMRYTLKRDDMQKRAISSLFFDDIHHTSCGDDR